MEKEQQHNQHHTPPAHHLKFLQEIYPNGPDVLEMISVRDFSSIE